MPSPMFNSIRLATILSCLAAATLAAPASQLEILDIPGPPDFNITRIDALGTGCPAGSTSYVLNAERTNVTVEFRDFYAQIGPGIATSKNRKSCQLTLGIDVPRGFAFGIKSVEYGGFYQLDTKVTGTQQSIYYFQGGIVAGTAKSSLVGPIDGAEYTYHDIFDFSATVQSPCGVSTQFNINMNLQADNSANMNGFGYLATNSMSTALTTAFTFEWHSCHMRLPGAQPLED